MAVWALGINHTTAPLDLRGRFAFAVDKIAPTLAQALGISRQTLQHAKQPVVVQRLGGVPAAEATA